MAKSVFIIHGRDLKARDRVVKFIKSMRLEWLTFESVSHGLGPNPYIANIILEGIRQADAVVALFTPDEQVAMFGPDGELEIDNAQGPRWQARPNVIFEAGVAHGIAESKTLLVTLGADVSMLSDLGGKHFVNLDQPKGSKMLRDGLTRILGPAKTNTKTRPIDFADCTRKRWPYYDELTELEAELKAQEVAEIPIMTLLEDVVEANPKKDWQRISSEALMGLIERQSPDAADDAYWWLIVTGFLKFDNIEVWFKGKGDSWKQSVKFSEVAPRGKALLKKVQKLANTV